MLGLAGEIADIAHIGAPFLGPGYIGESIGLVRAGGERAGRSPGEYEIDLTVSFAVSTDPAKARRMVMKGVAGSILWMAGADAFALPDWDRPAEFAVPEDLVRGLAERWRMWSGDPVPADLQEAITDDILDRFAVAGDPARCAARLDELAARFPEVTGFRFKLPPLSGPGSHDDFVEMIEGAGEVIRRFRREASAA
jgi:alkanesulfonate monooxygenase SsuD/methylene tetrahydromethanopterin reductase-like flavin-dependent oxidoreductase (luciferase family)